MTRCGPLRRLSKCGRRHSGLPPPISWRLDESLAGASSRKARPPQCSEWLGSRPAMSMLTRRRCSSLCQGSLGCNFIPQCVGNFHQTMPSLGMGVEQLTGNGCYVQPAPTPLGIGNGVCDLERQRKRGHPRISMPPWFIRALMGVSSDPVFRLMPSRFLCHAEKSPAGVPAVVTKRGWGAVRFRQLVKRRTRVGRPSVQY